MNYRRINRNRERMVQAALTVQKLHRGNVGRQYFLVLRDDMALRLKRRKNLAACSVAYDLIQYEECVRLVDASDEDCYDIKLLSMKIKCLYKLEKFDEVIATGAEIRRLDETNEEAFYLQSASLAIQARYQEAYDNIKLMMSKCTDPRDDVYRLVRDFIHDLIFSLSVE